MAEIPGEDLEGLRRLRAKIRPTGAPLPGTPGPGSAARRLKADQRSMLKETDGRRSRGAMVVRDAQVNFKVESATKHELVELSRQIDQSMVWVFERGLALVRAEAEGRLTIQDDVPPGDA